MRIAIFCHSIRSDWNHGNAHFLRGVSVALERLHHEVALFEPADGWSARSLAADEGRDALEAYRDRYPTLRPEVYDLSTIDLERAVDGVSLVIVHEWNAPELIGRLAALRRRGAPFRLLFHDTHHRSVSQTDAIDALELDGFDGVLAFGDALREWYSRMGWGRRAWTWHEAADTSVFRPRPRPADVADLVWVGNWGDEERTEEIERYLLEPARALRLSGRVYGVRYPTDAIDAVTRSGLVFCGRLANHRVPDVFAQHTVTVHVPRRPYVQALPGIPTIRVFEALACGIPLVSAPWHDVEGLFSVGDDFLMARTGDDMRRLLRDVLADPTYAQALADRGLATIRARHTCTHRAQELIAIARTLDMAGSSVGVA
jgi:spore maturation protein CgeB